MTASLGHRTSVVVPTRDEADGIGELLRRIDATGVVERVVVVDDGDDDLPAAVDAAAPTLDLVVDVIRRTGAEPRGGLGTAVLLGVEGITTDTVVVMDGDLQHPPEVLGSMLAALAGADLVVASRHDWDAIGDALSPVRRLASRVAGRAAVGLLGPRLGGLSDPMSGFFACRLAAIDLDRLRPNGYKVLLEIVATHPGIRTVEVPFVFARRRHGRSKAGLAEALRYLRHLRHLRHRTRVAHDVTASVPAVTGS